MIESNPADILDSHQADSSVSTMQYNKCVDDEGNKYLDGDSWSPKNEKTCRTCSCEVEQLIWKIAILHNRFLSCICTVADPGFPFRGRPRMGGARPQQGSISEKLDVETKESRSLGWGGVGWVGRGRRRPRIRQCIILT